MSPVSAIQYAFVNTEPVCFVEEVDQSTQYITGMYTRYESLRHNEIIVAIVLIDPHDEQINREELRVGEHNFAFKLQNAPSGSYRLCAAVTQSKWSASSLTEALIIDFHIDQSSANNPFQEASENAKMPKREVVDGKEVFVFRDFGGQLKSILQPREYLENVEKEIKESASILKDLQASFAEVHSKENELRSIAEITFTRIWICSIITILFILGVIYYEYYIIRKILRRRKLVERKSLQN